MKLYKTSDRIKVQIGDIVITISPLNFEQKIEIQTLLSGKMDAANIIKSSLLTMRYSIKDITGIELSDGEKYELSFEGGILTEECAKDLMNIEMNNELMGACNSFVNGVPREIQIEGVEIISEKKKKAKKK